MRERQVRIAGRFSLGVALLEPFAACRPLRERDRHELERRREPHGDEALEEHAGARY